MQKVRRYSKLEFILLRISTAYRVTISLLLDFFSFHAPHPPIRGGGVFTKIIYNIFTFPHGTIRYL